MQAAFHVGSDEEMRFNIYVVLSGTKFPIAEKLNNWKSVEYFLNKYNIMEYTKSPGVTEILSWK